MFTPTVKPIPHTGCSPHAPAPVKPRAVVKRRITLHVIDGHAHAVVKPAPVLRPETFVRW